MMEKHAMSDDLTAQCEYVAEKLLGWTRPKERPGYITYWYCGKQDQTIIAGPRALLTGNGMLEVIEKMRERGMPMHCGVVRSANNEEWWAKVGDLMEFGTAAFAESLPGAVIRAAYKALKEQPSDA